MDTSSKLFSSPLSLPLATSNHLHGQYLYSYCLSKSGETQQAQTCSLGGEWRGGEWRGGEGRGGEALPWQKEMRP